MHGNPISYTDPSGQFLCGGLCIAAAVILIAGGIAFTADYSIQTYDNMQAGMSFWDAAYYQNHNWGRTAFVTGEAMVLATIGVGVGFAIGAAGITGIGAWALGGIADVAVGTAWDMSVYNRSFSNAFVNNLFSFGTGEVAGYGLGRVARGLARNANVDAVVARRLAQLEEDIPYTGEGRLMAMVRHAEARRIVEQAGRSYIDDALRWEYSGVNPRMQHGVDAPHSYPGPGEIGDWAGRYSGKPPKGTTGIYEFFDQRARKWYVGSGGGHGPSGDILGRLYSHISDQRLRGFADVVWTEIPRDAWDNWVFKAEMTRIQQLARRFGSRDALANITDPINIDAVERFFEMGKYLGVPGWPDWLRLP